MGILVSALWASVAEAAGSQCALAYRKPQTLLSNETLCSSVSTGSESGCDTCVPKGWVCCDNGTGMAFDPFCRYPSDCCTEKFCGSQCLKPDGRACGDVVAPAGYQCCDSASEGQNGQLCKSPDSCCGDHCCPGGYSCCNSNDGTGHTCCEDGKVCCNGQCCAADTECCVDHCCLKNEDDQCAQGEVCCPFERKCADNLCCAEGEFCEAGVNQCCDGSWCAKGGICCHPHTFCNAAGGCCPENTKFCPYGGALNCHGYPFTECCSDGTACTAENPHCTGNGYCCPSAYPYYCAASHECFQHPCSCCGDKGGCCVDPYTCQSDACEHCHKEGSWWWKHTVCDHEPKSADKDNGGEKADPVRTSSTLPTRIPKLKGVKPLSASQIVAEESSGAKKGGAGSGSRAVNFLRRVGSGREAAAPSPTAPHPGGAVLPPPPSLILTPDHFSCWTKGGSQLSDVCYLLSCLQQMISCGDEGVLAQAHLLYCTNFGKFRSLFTPAGQQFLGKVQACEADAFRKNFAGGALPCCQSLEEWSTSDEQFACMKQSGFCNSNVFMTNIAAFDKLFESSPISASDLYFKSCKIA